MKTKKELIEQYYRENPEQEVRDRNSTIAEFAGPGIIGGLAGALTPKSKGILKNPTTGAGAGLLIGLPLWSVREAHRKKKILNEMGVDESVLGSFLEPIKRHI